MVIFHDSRRKFRHIVAREASGRIRRIEFQGRITIHLSLLFIGNRRGHNNSGYATRTSNISLTPHADIASNALAIHNSLIIRLYLILSIQDLFNLSHGI